jgi:signal transduction histidine kinase
MMNSIKAQLTVWLIVGITVIVAIMGVVSFKRSQAEGEAEYLALRNALLGRLSLSLPHGVWQLDDQYMRLTLDSELSWHALIAIRIRGDAGLNIGRIRDSHGLRDMRANEHPPADDVLAIPIIYQGKERLGNAYIFLSRKDLQLQRRMLLGEILMQILVLDSLILIVMSYALRRFVFRPLGHLQEALIQAASTNQLAALNIKSYQGTEFGEVMRSFNRIVERIMFDLRLRTQAESIARQEKDKAQEAYRQLLDAQRTLVESEKLASLGGLVAGVAHEINTPVGISLTTASHLSLITDQINRQLQEGAIKRSDFEKYLSSAKECSDLILSNAERAAQLIHSFKQVAVDQTSEERRDFSLLDYLREIITSLRPKFRRTRIEIQIDCPADLLMDSFPGALSQVVTNLLVNALLHAFDEGQTGRINILAEPRPPWLVCLQISDNGKGILPENLGRIFQPFFTTRRAQGGSGLGLHIVYNIVRQRLGGQIEVSSQLGCGTTFAITMPRVAPNIVPREEL